MHFLQNDGRNTFLLLYLWFLNKRFNLESENVRFYSDLQHYATKVDASRNDIFIYRSGTTKKAKGKSSKHMKQIRSLILHPGNGQTCLLGSKRIVSVCTRNGSNGGSSGFTGRKDENGTLTCQLIHMEN